MKVKIAELKDRLSEHLRAVEAGAEVIVTDRNRPIARIVPVLAAEASLALQPPTVAFATVRKHKHQPARWATPSSALLDRERSDR
jgi:prevent-host-death family protein